MRKKRSRSKPAKAKTPESSKPPQPAASNEQIPQIPTNASARAYKGELKEPWLDAYRKTGTIFSACQIIPVDRKTILNWRNNDPEFDQAFKDAFTSVTERIETTAIQRAIHGDRQPVIRNGLVVTDATGKPVTVPEYSDKLQTFFLETRNPDQYSRRIKQEISVEIIDGLAEEVIRLIRETIPPTCPHCKTNLHLGETIAQQLLKASAKMAKEVA